MEKFKLMPLIFFYKLIGTIHGSNFHEKIIGDILQEDDIFSSPFVCVSNTALSNRNTGMIQSAHVTFKFPRENFKQVKLFLIQHVQNTICSIINCNINTTS